MAALIVLIVGASWLGSWIKTYFDMELDPRSGPVMTGAIAAATLAYIALTALPFVPGAEIGIAMLSLLGASVAPLVYGATVLSLTLSYMVGRLIPDRHVAAGLRRIGLLRTATLVETAARLPPEDRLDYLTQGSGRPTLATVTRFRYVALALVINMPGNIVLGGGGGISLLAGMSGVFAPVPFVLTIMVAVLPVPLGVLLMGA